MTIARTPTTTAAATTTTTVANTRAADDDEGAATVGGRCGGGGGKSAARIAVERALGGAFDYKSVARDAVEWSDVNERARYLDENLPYLHESLL